MLDDIYEVGREDYIDFLHQIKTEERIIKEEASDDNDWNIKVYGNISKKLLCAYIDGHFYIYNTPAAEESIAPKPKMHVTLTPEETEEFYKIISDAMKEKKNARNI